MDTSTISLADGRRLDICISGPADGLPLLMHHGTPGSRVQHASFQRATEARGMRLITFSRAGYGHSTRRPGRTVADVVDDAAAVLAATGASECVVGGHSGGGPHALACAARLPGVRGAFVIAGVGPYGVDGLDFLAGMGEDNIVEFGHAAAGEESLRGLLEPLRDELLGASAEETIAALESILPPVDQEVFSGEYGAELGVEMAEGLSTGVDGWLDDDLAFLASWGFELDEIAVPTTIWQGDADLMVPFAHGRWLGDRIPNADYRFHPGEGHLSIAVNAFEQMLDSVLR